VTLLVDGGGSPVTGDLKTLATKVTAELLRDKKLTPKSAEVVQCIKEGAGLVPMNYNQLGELAGLGKNRKGRVSEAGKGTGTSGKVILAVIVANKLLSGATTDDEDALFTFGGNSKSGLGVSKETEAYLAQEANHDPHILTKCPEWKCALESVLVEYVKDQGTKPPTKDVPQFSTEVLRVFWILLEGSQNRNPSQESVFNGGEEALSSDAAVVRVVKFWLEQTKSQAARIISKAQSETPAAKKQKHI
jgi:hypothetical protein